MIFIFFYNGMKALGIISDHFTEIGLHIHIFLTALLWIALTFKSSLDRCFSQTPLHYKPQHIAAPRFPQRPKDHPAPLSQNAFTRFRNDPPQTPL